MGGKESKASFITYEDASKRVSDAEFKRLKEAFKRTSTLSGYMTKNLFIREVLGDGVPPKLAECIYETFGGNTKGLTFKDLLEGLVLVTRGRQDEKYKFLFGFYSNESHSHVQKEEMDRLVLSTEGTVPDALSDLFLETDKVSYEQFKCWLSIHKDVTSLTKWLLADRATVTLSNESETPTFYQTLAGVTHLEESEILELEKRYWVLKSSSQTGRLDVEIFSKLVCPPLPASLCQSVFNAFDENRDNHIDFKEIACGISACCKGPKTERQKFCFKIFDVDEDGLLSGEEIQAMLTQLLNISKENYSKDHLENNGFSKIDVSTLTASILEEQDGDMDGAITQEEYLVWTVSHPLALELLNMLYDICHVILGLKPSTREDEGLITMNWLGREDRRGLHIGQMWYLIGIQWWKTWLDWVLHRHQDYQPCESSTFPRTAPKKHYLSGRGDSMSPNLSPRHHNGSSDSFVVITKYESINGEKHEETLIPSCTLSDSEIINQALPHPDTRIGNGVPKTYTLSPQINQKNRSRSRSPSPKPLKKQISPYMPSKPTAIDNTPLIVCNGPRMSSLTSEGGQLKKNTMLADGRDFQLVSEALWKALQSWYGGTLALPRTVIASSLEGGKPELELYPISMRLFRHSIPPVQRPTHTTVTGMMSGIGAFVSSAGQYMGNHLPTTPRRYQAYTGCFSRQQTLQQVTDFVCGRLRINKDDMRLWKYRDELNMTLLEDEQITMEQYGIEDNEQVLIEVRNKDLTWPEEMSQLAKNRDKRQQVQTERGAAGLNNLGNTCFMNSAVQCLSNTRMLTLYFTGGMYLYELNRENPLGMKGHIAQRYGELLKDLWSGTCKATAPLRLRWTIGKYASQFNGFQQHDAQELLAFLLDGLHEDLNRVHNKPYVELKDSNGRPDEEVAMEAWENHLVRNRSVVVDLFHGQLKSQVKCTHCGHVSVRFDPLSYLSLPLPMDSCVHLEVIVFRLDGSVPIKYGLRLNMDEKYKALKSELSKLCGIPTSQILLAEIFGAVVKSLPPDHQKIRTLLGGLLYAYELSVPPPIKPMTASEERLDRPAESTVGRSPRSSCELESPSRLAQSQLTDPPSPTKHLATQFGHSRNASSCSTNSSVGNSTHDTSTSETFDTFVVGFHRKMFRMDNYFISSQKTRPSLFGTPLILPCEDSTTHEHLYKAVWVQMSRFISPLPVTESSINHAQDCDDSLAYEYPFTLKVVQKDGFTCAWCPWYQFCRGCKLDCSANELFHHGSSYIAIDWDPTAVHLRYQSSLERIYEEHASVAEARRLQNEPIDLDACLRAFTKREELGEDELYYCSKCKQHRLAAKKLDIWKLPPILIIHLKRFQFLNGRWVKSHKIVNFPKTNFDPSMYVAQRTNYASDGPNSVPEYKVPHQSTVKFKDEVSQSEVGKTCDQTDVEPNGTGCGCASDDSGRGDSGCISSDNENEVYPNHHDNELKRKYEQTIEEKRQDFRQRHVSIGEYDKARYDLYALSSHSGILGGGHYVAYAKNPNCKWYCYNDSSCKEIDPDQIDTTTSYLLFYERKGLDYSKFMPDIEGKNPDVDDIDDEFESDFKKMCLIQ